MAALENGPTQPSGISSEVEFQLTFSDGSFIKAIVQVHIDSDDNVTLNLPDDLRLEDHRLSSVSLHTSTKVNVLPDLLFHRFGSDGRLFHSTCACFINLTFVNREDKTLRCNHCDFFVNTEESSSRSEMIETLLQHLPLHHDHLPCLKFACKKCPPPSAVSMDEFVKHLELVHPDLSANNESEATNDETEYKEFVCPVCSMVCFDEAKMAKHISEYHSTPSDSRNSPSIDDVLGGIEVAPGIIVKQEPLEWEEDDGENKEKAQVRDGDLLGTLQLKLEAADDIGTDDHPVEALAQKSQLLKVQLTLDGHFGCQLCGKKCKSENALKKHVQVHIVNFQPEGKTAPKRKTKPKKAFNCKLCGEEFDSSHAVRKHKALEHANVERVPTVNYNPTIDMNLTLKIEPKKEEKKRQERVKPEEMHQEMGENNNKEKEELGNGEDPSYIDDGEDDDFNLSDGDETFDDKPRRKRRKKRHFSKECPICHKVLTRANSMAVHLRSHTGEKPFKCSKCGKGCQTSQHLKQHMLIHTGEQPYECEICKRRFRDPSSRKRHLRLHEAGRPIKQFIKPTLMVNPETGDLKEVLLDPLNGTPIKSDVEATGQGETPSEKKGMFPCAICKKVFTSSSSLATHNRSHTGERPYSCNFCHKTFLTTQHLKHHTMIHTGEKPHVCNLCGKAFIARGSLRRHEEIHNADREQSHRVPKKRRLKPEAECDICGKQFLYAKSLVEHRRIHTRERPYSCKVCDKTFARVGNLRIHMYQHNDMYKYRCSHCGKGCVTASQLRVHESIHTGVKPHICSICGKGFADPHRLKLHEYSHQDTKPHVCSECGRGYVTNQMLKFHMRKHTGEKPYMCSSCGRSFAFQKNLKDHMMTHTGELPFKCSACGKAFRTNWRLTCHKRLHTGEKPYKCSKCGDAFRAHSTLYGHMQRHKVTEGLIPSNYKNKHKPFKDMKEMKPAKPKNFFCEHCQSGFVRKESLKKHMMKNETCRVATNFVDSGGRKDPGITQFHCEKCDKYFSGYQGLYKHRKIHERTEHDKLTCNVDGCTATYWRNNHLLQHKRKVHGSEKSSLDKNPGALAVGSKKVPKMSSLRMNAFEGGHPPPPPLQHSSQFDTQQKSMQSSSQKTPSPVPTNLRTNTNQANESVFPGEMQDNSYFSYPQQPQFPYPQMLSAQSLLHGAISHFMPQVPSSQHHLSHSGNNRRPSNKTDQFIS